MPAMWREPLLVPALCDFLFTHKEQYELFGKCMGLVELMQRDEARFVKVHGCFPLLFWRVWIRHQVSGTRSFEMLSLNDGVCDPSQQANRRPPVHRSVCNCCKQCGPHGRRYTQVTGCHSYCRAPSLGSLCMGPPSSLLCHMGGSRGKWKVPQCQIFCTNTCGSRDLPPPHPLQPKRPTGCKPASETYYSAQTV